MSEQSERDTISENRGYVLHSVYTYIVCETSLSSAGIYCVHKVGGAKYQPFL